MNDSEKIVISLILCSRNRSDQLAIALKKLDQEGVKKNHGEVVLVDSASTDNSLIVMEEFQDNAIVPVTIVRMERKGLGRARNEGIKSANGGILVFWDDDVYFEKGYFDVVAKIFCANDWGISGGRIWPYDKKYSRYGCNFIHEFYKIEAGSTIRAGEIQGTNLVVKREVLDKVGMFDPDLGAGTKYRCEDIDFLARAINHGISAAHVPELIVLHDHQRLDGKEIKILKRQNNFARGAFYCKMIVFLKISSYKKVWLQNSLLKKNMHFGSKLRKFCIEISGALSYAIFRVFKKKELINND